MMKNQFLLFSFLLVASNLFIANPTDHEKLLAAIKAGHKTEILNGIEARERAAKSKTRDMSALLSAVEEGLPQAQTVATEAGAAAQIVSTVTAASGNQSVASVASGVAAASAAIEPVLASFESGNAQSEDAALLQAAQEGEKTALASSGIGSRLLAAGVAAGCIAFVGIKVWADCFSTDNATAQQRAAALATDSGVIVPFSTLGLGSLYYAVTNKYNTSVQTQAKMINRVVKGHVAELKN